MDIYGILIFVLPLLLIAALGFYYGRKILRWSGNNHSEIITFKVTVIEKKEKYLILGASPEKGLSAPSSPRRYYLYCKASDGKEIRCEVPFDVFDRVKEGRSCLLTMQGTRFIAFERIEEDEANG